MAVFPQGLAASGPHPLIDALARHLDEDDITVWHALPILGSARRPGCVILHPLRGLLLLETRDWKLTDIQDANPIRVELTTNETHPHPLSQARGHAQDVHRLLEKHPTLCHTEGPHKGKVILPCGWGAVLGEIDRAALEANANLLQVFDPAKVLLADDLKTSDPKAFHQRLLGMLPEPGRNRLNDEQIALIRALLFPELRITSGPPLPAEPALPALVLREPPRVLDRRQEAMARAPATGHRVIEGPTGTGKTTLLLHRAVQLAAHASEDQPVLVLCCSPLLADRIGEALRAKGVGPQVQVRTYMAWAAELVEQYELGNLDDLERKTDRTEAAARLVREGIARGRLTAGEYAAILIDEAHEMPNEWIAAAVQLVDPATQSLLVAHDPTQSTKPAGWLADAGVQPREAPARLDTNYRNTREVLALAGACARSLLGQESDSAAADTAERSGLLPVFKRLDTREEELRYVAGKVKALLAAGRPARDIAILARRREPLEELQQVLAGEGLDAVFHRRQRRGKAVGEDAVLLATLHSSKGLEFPVVFVMGLDLMLENKKRLAEEVRLLVTGITRSGEELFVCAGGGGAVADAVAAAVAGD